MVRWGLTSHLRGWDLYLAIILIMGIAFFVFKDFLLLKNVLLFKDIGSDSITNLYPLLINVVDYIGSEGIPKWSFNQGMGQSILGVTTFDPFLIVFYLIGRDNLAFGLAYVEVLKIVLGGFFFFLYLRALSLSQYSAIVGGLLYSFTGYMILGGGWYIFSYDALCISLLLYSFEKLFQANLWYLLPIPIALISSYQPFYLYLYAILLFVYTLIRIIDEKGWDLNRLSLFFLKLASLFLLGMGISSVFLASNVLQLAQSPRVGGEASYFHTLMSQPVFGLAVPIQYISELLRTYSSDMLGTGNSFRGWGNYLESPLSYCGLISLLLAPQFFSFIDRRRRILYSLVFGAIAVPLVFPFFRYLFWGFTGDYFRAFSFFIVLGLLYLSLKALSYIDTRGHINMKVLAISLVIAISILYVPFGQKNQILNQGLRATASIFLVLYAILLAMMQSKRRKAFAQLLLLVAVCAELGYFSRITVNDRDVLSAKELRAKVGYNDFSNEAAAFIHSIDQSFFRVNKDYFSGPAMHSSLNDAEIQGYYGTISYHSFNQKYYIQFLQAVGVIRLGDEFGTRWAMGLSNRPLLQITGSVKYMFTKRTDNYLSPEGYEYMNTLGDVRVSRSKYALPLGFTYDTFITESDFAKLSQLQKDIALLRAVAVREDQRAQLGGFQSYAFSDTTATYTFVDLEHDTRARREDTLAIDHHSQNHFKGSVHVEKRKLLFFSIPYDKGWSATVDGHEASLDRVNIGFMGLWLEPGAHTIELEFEPPLLVAGAAVSLASLLAYGGLLVWWKKRRTETKSTHQPRDKAESVLHV